MRTIFGFLLLIHGFIHLMGFIKAFELADISVLSHGISKPTGMLWLLTTLLFLVTTSLFFLKKDLWPILALVSVLVSQFLIVMYWKDAKFGTIANIIILLVSIPAYGNYKFSQMVQRESLALLQNLDNSNTALINNNDTSQVPSIIQKWMQTSGIRDKKAIYTARLKQLGEMRTTPESNWMRFTAEQYFDVTNPSFIWTTKVETMPLITTSGRDIFTNAEGEMLIKLAGLIPVVDERKNEKINQGTMLRFLAEICWFPSAALNKYIKWEEIDSTSAKATFSLNKKSVSGVFKFSEKGKFLSFETQRYYGGALEAKLEKWHIEAVDYKVIEGYYIPYKCKVIWKLKEGDFNWLNLEITDLQYNNTTLYD